MCRFPGSNIRIKIIDRIDTLKTPHILLLFDYEIVGDTYIIL